LGKTPSQEVRVLTPLIDRIRQHVVIKDDCWEWFGAYQSCGATPMLRYHHRTVSVRSAIIQDQGLSIPRGRVATYTCGNPKCVNPEHVAVWTRAKVQKRSAKEMPLADKLARNKAVSVTLRDRIGKLTDSDILAIRNSEETEKTLALRYNVTTATIGSIRRMKIRSETIAMLKLLDAQEFPDTARGFAQIAGTHEETMRTYLNRYHAAGLLNKEERYNHKPTGMPGPKKVAYYWTNAKAKELIASREDIPQRKPKPARRMVNSVFALGDFQAIIDAPNPTRGALDLGLYSTTARPRTSLG
jgi:hypothetical protein